MILLCGKIFGNEDYSKDYTRGYDKLKELLMRRDGTGWKEEIESLDVEYEKLLLFQYQSSAYRKTHDIALNLVEKCSEVYFIKGFEKSPICLEILRSAHKLNKGMMFEQEISKGTRLRNKESMCTVIVTGWCEDGLYELLDKTELKNIYMDIVQIYERYELI